jgi:hypothetical protein
MYYPRPKIGESKNIKSKVNKDIIVWKEFDELDLISIIDESGIN